MDEEKKKFIDLFISINNEVDNIEFTTSPGTVDLLQATGSDNSVVCAALVNNEFNKITSPEVRHFKLMEEMPHSGHWGCADHNFVTFNVNCTIASARQILRASNMNFNELSLRYLQAIPLFYIPGEFNSDVKRKELGVYPEPVEDQSGPEKVYKKAIKEAYRSYLQMYKLYGVRKEQARFTLPLCIYTKFWMSGRLSDWYHFLNLRLDPHTQYETRYIAEQMYNEILEKYPKTTEYWEAYAKGPLPSGCIQTP